MKGFLKFWAPLHPFPINIPLTVGANYLLKLIHHLVTAATVVVYQLGLGGGTDTSWGEYCVTAPPVMSHNSSDCCRRNIMYEIVLKIGIG